MKQLTSIKELGLIIRSSRKKQNLTQEQISTLCGVGIRYIRELEHGKESCHIGKAFFVAQMLGLQISIDEGEG